MASAKGISEKAMPVHCFSLSIAGLLLMVVITGQAFGLVSSRGELQLLTAMAAFYLLIGSFELASLKVKDFWNSAPSREM